MWFSFLHPSQKQLLILRYTIEPNIQNHDGQLECTGEQIYFLSRFFASTHFSLLPTSPSFLLDAENMYGASLSLHKYILSNFFNCKHRLPSKSPKKI